MATGRGNQLTKQAGEYLVAAEVCRRGFIAATFTGNVPHYDIIASNSTGGHQAIQVKAIVSGSWQFDISRFVDAIKPRMTRSTLPLGWIWVRVGGCRPSRDAPSSRMRPSRFSNVDLAVALCPLGYFGKICQRL